MEGVFSCAFHGGPLGPSGQYARKRTRVRWRSSTPKWDETLELRLPSRTIGDDGSLTGDTVAPFTKLRIELWDRDVFSHDDFIGEVTIPLTPMLDGRRHRYTLGLTDPEKVFGGGSWGASLSGEVTLDVALES